MRLHHPDYTSLVMRAYREKRGINELPLLLSQPTPAKIRQACLHMYREQVEKKEYQLLRKDEQVLRDFFGPAEPGKAFLQKIREFDTDRFRPLDNYLKGHTEKTDNTNLELLAWLINFQHRPYLFDKNFQLSDEEIHFLKNNEGKQRESITGNTGRQDDVKAPGIAPKGEAEAVSVQMEKELDASLPPHVKIVGGKKLPKKAVMIGLVLVIGFGGIYAGWQHKQGKQSMTENAKSVCVYWADDHYEKVPCNEDSKGRIVISMNPEKVSSFRRITQEDTITEWSVGRLYYIKDRNSIKYYTEEGNYPEDLNRRLKVLSQYIYERHLRKKGTPGKDSLAKQNRKVSGIIRR